MPVEFDRFHHGRLTIDGVQLHYRRSGRGEPVLLLHGWPQHSLQWDSVAPGLADHYDVIVPDLPGCGGSSIPVRASYDKATVAGYIGKLLSQLAPGPVRVVGYDHGAGVAYNVARQNPSGVSHLCFVEYILPGCGYERAMMPTPEWHTGSNWQLALFTVPDVAEFAFRGRERELLNWFFWHGSCNPSPVSAAHLQDYVDQISRPGALRAGIEYYAAVWRDMESNKQSMQTKLTMRALGIGGRHNMGEMVGRAMANVAEHASGAVIEDAGHWVSDENPQALTSMLLDFLARPAA